MENLKSMVKRNPKKFQFVFKIMNKLNPWNKLRCNRKNTLTYKTAWLHKVKVKINGTGNLIMIGDKCKVFGTSIRINGNNSTVIIGDDVYMNESKIVLEGDNNELRIGDGTSFTARVQLAAIESSKLIIGENCLFSTDIHIRTGDSHSILDEEEHRINPPEDIRIGNNVWVGTRAVCLKGGVIPDNCMVGACSLITKKFVSKNCILAGIPAKVIKENVHWVYESIASGI